MAPGPGKPVRCSVEMALTTGEMSAKELKCVLEQEKADFSPQSLRVCECGAVRALAFRLTAQAKRRVQEAKRALDDAVSSGEAEAIDNRRLAWATVLLASPDDAEVEKGLGTCLGACCARKLCEVT